MKKLIVIVLIGLLLNSCKTKSGSIEKELYSCLMNSLSQEEKEKISPIVSGYEKHLITKGILESSSAKSYWNLYENIVKTGTFDFTNEFNFHKKISFLNRKKQEELQGLIDCNSEIFKTDMYLASNIYKIKKEIESLNASERIKPLVIATAIVKYMSPKDFELEYNRFSALLFIERFK